AFDAEAKIGPEMAEPSDAAALHLPDQLLHQRMATVHVSFQEQDTFLASGIDHALSLGVIDTQRLFAKNVLAGFDAEQRLFFMSRMRSGDVDGFHVGMLRQLSYRLGGGRDAPTLRERASFRRGRTRDTHNLTAAGVFECLREVGG